MKALRILAAIAILGAAYAAVEIVMGETGDKWLALAVAVLITTALGLIVRRVTDERSR
jgi:hypothetical protein